MNYSADPLCLFTINAEADACTPERVLGMVTRLNVLPNWFSARRIGADEVRIVLELQGFNPEQAELLMKRISNISTVLSVSSKWVIKRTTIIP